MKSLSKPTASAPDPLLEIDRLSVDIRSERGVVRVVDEVSFAVGPRETVALVGESGSGKSVTSMSVLGLLPPRITRTHGSVRFEGRELLGLKPGELDRVRGDDIAMIFQEPMTSLNPAFTVGEQIAEQVRRHRGVSRRAARDRAVEVLDLVGVPSAAERLKAYPHEFSGGMRQRVMMAMALSCEPKLVIADEPTTALDVTIQALVLSELRALQERFGMSVLFITHDLGVVAEIADKVVVMYGGHLVETGRTAEVFASPRHPYTEALLRSVPQGDTAGSRLWSIPGTMPTPEALPRGCRFHPRCPYAQRGVCDTDEPPLEPVGDGRTSRCVRRADLRLTGIGADTGGIGAREAAPLGGPALPGGDRT
ncbi:ABC transporter ATP-binding protein [Actinomadura livida]|uniref:ABC transporter ATP-binding protein n=1 Tax=Actinomadura livida TaxID=79909 RepID=A0A7W7MXA7_9ACTN|nr:MULTISPECIES: ABC transporter ATP-binding protein [Actinomadura]MBB4773600.1 oligopeptide/dipeptide ABC transporter ATP-binding protein [Actinomadura catellatispora]GGU09426.1 ABC transporter ATP-binding protein [Actinomadura livida]